MNPWFAVRPRTRDPLDPLHREIEPAVGRHAVIHVGDDRRVRQPGEELRFAVRPLDIDLVADREDLHRHREPGLLIDRAIDDAHATRRDLAFDAKPSPDEIPLVHGRHHPTATLKRLLRIGDGDASEFPDRSSRPAEDRG